MKKYVAAAVLVMAALAFAACGGDEDATLTIKNESSTDIIDVSWNGARYGRGFIQPAGVVNLKVTAGSGYIFLRFIGRSGIVEARTRDLVIVEDNTTTEFVFTGNTLVSEVANPSNFATVNSFL